MPAKGVNLTPRCLTIATSDSGGGAGIQADLKAFAAAGCHGSSALVALTAQNTVGVTAIHELPPHFVLAQLEAVFEDIGVDAAKTGMLCSRTLIEAVTGGHGMQAVDHLVDGTVHEEIPVERYGVRATHGAGCTHSATLAALLAKGELLANAARGASVAASRAVKNGLVEIGQGEGPVN